MCFLSNADLQVEQIFRAFTFCPLIIVLITFPNADGFFINYLFIYLFIIFEVIVKIFMS